MKPRCRRSSLLVLTALFSSSLAAAQEPPLPAERPVLGIELLHRGGARPAFSAQGDVVAFDQAGEDGRYDLYVLPLDSRVAECISCKVYDLKKRHNLNPAWHPSGEVLVFQSQSISKRLGLQISDLVTPDRGVHSDLFAITLDGRGYWQLTPQSGVLLDPHLSFEGDRLSWSERVAKTKTGRWGEWVIRVATFQTGRTARLTKIKTFQPGEQKGLMVNHGFAPNDRSILLSGNLESGQSETGADIYLLDLKSKQAERLTHSRRAWDVHAHFSPKGDRIVWASNAELPQGGPSGGLEGYLLRDLWIMNADGSDKQRLTYFNHASAPEGLDFAYVGDFSWSPRGDQIVVHVVTGRELHEDLYLIQLDDGFRR